MINAHEITDIKKYNKLRFAAIAKLEGTERGIYMDTARGGPLPTIGIGFNLGSQAIREAVIESLGVDPSNNALSPAQQALEQDYFDRLNQRIGQFNALNFDANGDGKLDKGENAAAATALQSDLDAIMAERADHLLLSHLTYITQRKTFTYDSVSEMESTFLGIVEGSLLAPGANYETQVNNEVSGIANSYERIALLSLAYNGVLDDSTKLTTAIQDGDRARAWYEIRYQTNAGSLDTVQPNDANGIAKRRYLESTLFGLYEPNQGEPSLEEASSIYRMYTEFHEDVILPYEERYRAQVAQAQLDANAAGLGFNVPTLGEALAGAGETLLDYYGYDVNTPGNLVDYRDIQVAYDGNENLTGHTREGFVLGTGQEQNDLLIGSDNANTLQGGGGNDILIGLGGDDTLIGGAGSNVLVGGDGYDTYVFNEAALLDGSLDVIDDSDGSGVLMINGTALDLSTLGNAGPNIWSTEDGEIQVILSPVPSINSVQFTTQSEATGNSDLFVAVNRDGSTHRFQLRNFQNSAFGITLPEFEELTVPEIATTNVINGTEDADSESGTAANDAINTFSGNDSADGKEGDDYINLGAGDDSANGGLGNDHILGGSGQDRLWGNAGNDVIEGGSEFDLILGDVGDDMLFANSSEDYNTILDSDGVTPGADNDWLNAGAGNDLLVGSTGDNGLSGGEGADRIYGGAGNDALFGDQFWLGESTWSMTIVNNPDGSITADFVDARNQTLGEPGPGGNDILIGGAGDDYLEGDRGNDILDGGIGNDLIGGGSGEDTIRGGDGNDYLYGDSPYIYVSEPDGQGGIASEKRYIPEEHGADIIDGGAGDDYLQGHGGNDILAGGDGNDELHGDDDEADLPVEYHGDDRLDGGAGDDLIFGYGGDDEIVGGDGNDTLAGDISETRLTGSAHGDDRLDGGAGEDLIAGYGGNDVIFGGDDNDQLQGDASIAELRGEYHGNDILYGGLGDDTIWGSGADDTLHGGGGNDRLEGDASDISGEYQGKDTIYGDAGDDQILGGGAGDRLFGGDGNDQILGDDFAGITSQYHGDDYIDGGNGDDVIRGNGGDDTIIGGVGVDHMGGGAGNDVYILNSGDSFYDPQGFIEVIDDREGVNTVRFGDGITADDVSAQIWDDNLQINYGSNDSVLILGGADGNTVSRFEFADGSRLSWSEFFGYAYATPLNMSSADIGATLLGGAGDDSLSAFGGRSLLSGGRGNDTLGGAGGDTFLFSVGDGADVISGQGLDPNNPNTIRFGAGIDRNMLNFTKEGSDLLIGVGYGTGDSLRVQNFRTDLLSGAYSIDQFEFHDGSTLSYNEVLEQVGFVYIGGDSSETLSGTTSTDRMLGLGGNDVLDAGEGDDFLAGGTGNDTLRGGAGFDSYYVGNFEGVDRIEEVDDGAGNQLQFGYGITPDNLAISANEGGDLVFSLPNAGQVTVVDGFGSDGVRHISSVLFQNGTEWNAQEVLAHYLSSASDGDDYLLGTRANDTLAGGKGNDTLIGGEGDDLYLYESGDGADTIFDVAGADTLRFGEGLVPDDWTVAGNGRDLILRHNNGSDEVTVQDWFVDPAYEIERIEFFDGTVWQPEDVVQGLANQVGTAGDDVLVAPYTLASSLSGLAGNDTLTGGSANDTLDGGAGNDVLVGDLGDDTYLFQAGHGSDIVEDTGGTDRIVFDDTVARGDLSAERDGLDVLITAANGVDVIRIADWFTDSTGGRYIESVVFADGSEWTAEELTAAALIQEGDAGNNRLDGLDGYDNQLFGHGGADILVGGSGDDTLVGGTGSDMLFGAAGDDRYVYESGDGNDRITDTAGFDSLVFGPGVTRDSVTWERNGNNLAVSAGGGLITVVGWFSERDGAAQLERFEFADGQVVTAEEINQPWLTLTGTENGEQLRGTDALSETILGLGGADHLLGLAGDDQLFGGDGNDLLEGGDGADTLQGDAGDDSLLGGDGDDLLTGGAGADAQFGGRGDDTYYYSAGDGDDSIYDSEGVNDRLNLVGINPEEVTITRDLADLAITVSATSETIRLRNWFIGESDRIESIEFADGSSITAADINALFPITLGTAVDDTLVGNDAVNMLYGLGGNDTLYGNGGDDFLDGGSGSNTLYGGLGDDTYIAGTGAIQEAAGEGNDTLLVTAGGQSFTLAENVENGVVAEGAAGNSLYGNALDNYLLGNSQNQILDGGAGQDILEGGRGDDTYYVDNTGDAVIEVLGAGYDTINATISYELDENVENLRLLGAAVSGTGNALDNVLYGNAQDNMLDGGAGNDWLNGGTGADTLIGGTGDDTYIVDSRQDVITETAGGGIDRIELYLQNWDAAGGEYYLPDQVENLHTAYGSAAVWATVVGNDLDNIIDGRNSFDPSRPNDPYQRVHFDGGAGNDTLYGGIWDDDLNGGAGADRLIGGNGGDTYYVDSPDDVIEEYSWHTGIDRVRTSVDYTLGQNLENLTLLDGAITGTGNAFDNYIVGNSDDNILSGGLGVDRLQGGDGDDTYIMDVDADSIIESSGKKAGSDTVLAAIDYALGNNVENLTLTGSADIDATGNELNNVLTGNAGDNVLDGGAGKDSMAGGAGNDTYIVDESRESITELAGDGIDTVVASQSHKLDANVENLELTGTASIDGAGNELDNWLIGNVSDNVLNGNEGNDHLIGGMGVDVLNGGVGSDTYYFGRGDNSDELTDQHSAKGRGPVPENYDVLHFGESIGVDQLWFAQNRSDLIVSVIGTGDQVTINNWYRNDDFHIEEFRTSDGLYLLDSQVDNLVSAMADFAPPPPGQMTLSDDYRSQLEPVISSNWQS